MYYVCERTHGKLLPIGAFARKESAQQEVQFRLGAKTLKWESRGTIEVAVYKGRTFTLEATGPDARS